MLLLTQAVMDFDILSINCFSSQFLRTSLYSNSKTLIKVVVNIAYRNQYLLSILSYKTLNTFWRFVYVKMVYI